MEWPSEGAALRPRSGVDGVFARVSDADRERLVVALAGSEEWLMQRVLDYAHELGYTRYTSTLLEAWRLSIDGLTESIALVAAREERVPELHPDDDYSADPGAAFGIAEARAHRRRGVNLAMFLGLFKYYRQAYHRLLEDPVQCPVPFDDPAAVTTYLDRVFDRIELGYTSEWAGTDAETQIRELSTANLLATNEKTRMLTLIESLPIPAMLISPQRTVDMVNHAAAEAILGLPAVPGHSYYRPEEPKGNLPEWMHAAIDAAEQDGGTHRPGDPIEVVANLGSDGLRTFQVYVEPMLDISAKFAGHAVLVVDVTRERLDGLALREAAAVFKDSTNAIVVTDPDGVVLAVNPAMRVLMGRTDGLEAGADIADYLGGDEGLWPRASQHTRPFWTDRQWHGEVTLTTSAGEPVTGWLNLSCVENAAGEVRRVIGVFTDVSSLKRSEERFEHLSNHDPLTGLYNRTGLRAELEDVLFRAHRRRRSVAVVFLDLDRFKEINDSHGHSIGDQLLRQVAERLQKTLRHEDLLARIGGDEFLAVAAGVRNDEETHLIAEKVLSCLRSPLHIGELSFEITGSAGVAVFPRDGEDVELLIRNADAAMYRAKGSGPDQFALYSPELTEQAAQRLQLATELRAAIRTGHGLTLVYQPLLDLRTGDPVAVEALLRWRHDVLDNVPPAVFIPIAEDIGLMPRLGAWVFAEALGQLGRWEAAGLHVPQICINSSPSQIERIGFEEELLDTLAQKKIAPQRLVLEVTEEALFRGRSGGVRALRRIREFGVEVAIDDFGDGYSSLSRLQNLPVDIVKIDRAFIGEWDSDDNGPADRRAVTKAISGLVHAFGKKMVAEGVEDRTTAQYLIESECEFAQGYLYAHPLPPSELAARWPHLSAR